MTVRHANRPQLDTWLTVPNVVTVTRLVLVVPIVALLVSGDRPASALALLIVFGVSDWVDGFLARRLGQVSKAGTILDPIADRLGVAAIMVGFVLAGMLAPWVVIVIVVVDAAVALSVAVGGFRAPPRVSTIGKVRTALLMVGLALLGFGLLPGYARLAIAGQLAAMVGTMLHLLAGIGYVRAALTAQSVQVDHDH